MVAQQPAQRQNEGILRDLVQKGIVRAVKNEQFGAVPGGDAGSQAAAQRAPVQDNALFAIGFGKPFVNLLQVGIKDRFASLAGTLAKPAVIENEKIETFSYFYGISGH